MDVNKVETNILHFDMVSLSCSNVGHRAEEMHRMRRQTAMRARSQ